MKKLLIAITVCVCLCVSLVYAQRTSTWSLSTGTYVCDAFPGAFVTFTLNEAGIYDTVHTNGYGEQLKGIARANPTDQSLKIVFPNGITIYWVYDGLKSRAQTYKDAGDSNIWYKKR